MKRVLIVFALFVATTAAFAAEPKGFVWGNQPAAPSYVPDPVYAYNSTGGGITITRLGMGSYRILFVGLSAAGAGHKSNVQVTAYAERTTCNTGGWSAAGPDLNVTVTCFYIPDGSMHDSKFTALVTFSP